MKALAYCLLVLLLMGNGIAHAEFRIWTSKKGDTIEAEYVNIFSGKVVLLLRDGRQIKVPMDGLSEKDIKFLKNSMPVKMDLKVSLDKDRKTVSSYSSDYSDYGQDTKREHIVATAIITKASREPTDRKFRASLFVFGKDITDDEIRVLSKTTEDFDFKQGDKVEIQGDPASVTYTKSTYSDRGDKYEGYLLVVEDDNDKIAAVCGSSNLIEKSAENILKANKGACFDEKFRWLNKPSSTSKPKSPSSSSSSGSKSKSSGSKSK